jgi:hypothetical protein
MARKKLLTEGEIRQFMKLANLRPIDRKKLSEYGMPPGNREEEDELGDEDALADEEGAELDAAEDDLAMDDAGGAGDMISMDDFMSALEQAIEEVTGEEADVSEEPGDEEMDMEMDMEMGPEGGEEVEMEMGAEEEMMQEIVRRVMERQKYGGNKGDIPDADRKKKGHYGRGGKTRETAEEEGEEDFKEGLADARPAPHRRPRGLPRQPDDDDPANLEPLVGEPSEVEGGYPYDPAEDEEAAARGGRRRPSRRSPSGVRMPAMGMEEQLVNRVAQRVAARLQAETRKQQVVDTLAERIMRRLTK